MTGDNKSDSDSDSGRTVKYYQVPPFFSLASPLLCPPSLSLLLCLLFLFLSISVFYSSLSHLLPNATDLLSFDKTPSHRHPQCHSCKVPHWWLLGAHSQGPLLHTHNHSLH